MQRWISPQRRDQERAGAAAIIQHTAMAAKIVDGSYMARGINMEGVKSDNTGNKGVTVTFSIVDEGPYKGALIDWTGWLGENTRERTAESISRAIATPSFSTSAPGPSDDATRRAPSGMPTR